MCISCCEHALFCVAGIKHCIHFHSFGYYLPQLVTHPGTQSPAESPECPQEWVATMTWRQMSVGKKRRKTHNFVINKEI